jgi:hypothetical protein
LLAEL